jgi:hypothetical protein
VSTDKINENQQSQEDIMWQKLIRASESRISQYKSEISKLHKSIKYFSKQIESGTPFPLDLEVKSKDFS